MGTYTFHAHTTQVAGLFITNSLKNYGSLYFKMVKYGIKFPRYRCRCFWRCHLRSRVGFQVLRTLVTWKLNSLSSSGIIIRFPFLKTVLNIAYFASSKLSLFYRKLPSTAYLQNRGTCTMYNFHSLSEWMKINFPRNCEHISESTRVIFRSISVYNWLFWHQPFLNSELKDKFTFTIPESLFNEKYCYDQ